MTLRLTAALLAGSLVIAGIALAQIARTPSPKDAGVYFVTLEDTETVRSPVLVHFGLRGMGVAPAGADLPNTGHHHLIIDAPPPALDLPLPADEQHRHFGGGQTEVELTLPPGEHTLQLVLADKIHLPHDPPILSEVIAIRVK